MAETTSIILNTTATGGKKSQKAITNVNPSANKKEIYEFATSYAALSTDTLEEIVRVDRTPISSSDLYTLSGDDNINMVYDADDPTSAYSIANYIILNGDTPIKSGVTWTWTPVGTIDTSKASIVPISNEWFAYITVQARANEDYVCFYDLSATFNGNSITKRIRINIWGY